MVPSVRSRPANGARFGSHHGSGAPVSCAKQTRAPLDSMVGRRPPLDVQSGLKLVRKGELLKLGYPILGNEDWRASDRLREEALAKAAHAVPSPDDPPEFTGWLTTLRDRSLPNHDRQAAMPALYDLFDPEQE
jgi:hypothetical protein